MMSTSPEQSHMRNDTLKIHQKNRTFRHAVAEILESRRLLSISFSNGIIGVRGGAGDDVVSVSLNENGGRVVVKLNTSVRRFNTVDVIGIALLGRGGNDYLALADNVAISATIH